MNLTYFTYEDAERALHPKVQTSVLAERSAKQYLGTLRAMKSKMSEENLLSCARRPAALAKCLKAHKVTPRPYFVALVSLAKHSPLFCEGLGARRLSRLQDVSNKFQRSSMRKTHWFRM